MIIILLRTPNRRGREYEQEEEEEEGGTASHGGRLQKQKEIAKRARLLSSDGKVFFLDQKFKNVNFLFLVFF